jgi:hypothetical protein
VTADTCGTANGNTACSFWWHPYCHKKKGECVESLNYYETSKHAAVPALLADITDTQFDYKSTG